MDVTTVSDKHRSKAVAAWLACVAGVVGAHAWYMGRKDALLYTGFTVLMLFLAQLYPSWWDNPAFLALIIPLTAGYIEALVYALTPDATFDRKYNAGSVQITRTGWNAVLAAIFATLIGAIVVMFFLAMIVMHVYIAMGWLDGYVF